MNSSLTMDIPSTDFRLVTIPGLEDLARSELDAHLRVEPSRQAPLPCPGQVVFRTDSSPEEVLLSVSQMHSVSDVIRHFGIFRLSQEDPVGGILTDLRESGHIPSLTGETSFRVTCVRRGNHSFRSPEIERSVGAVVQERYGSPVDLTAFRCHVRIDIHDDVWLLGEQLNRDRIDLRFPRIYHPRISLRTPVAYALVILATGLSGTNLPRVFVDPFCGSGIIPLEIASLFPRSQVYAFDREEAAVAGSMANVHAAGMSAQITVENRDARELTERFESGSVDYIITDPPFGVRLGKNIDFYHLYRNVLVVAQELLRGGGRMSLLVARNRHLFRRALSHVGGFRIVHARALDMAGLHPVLFVLEKSDH